ncbi:MAG: hypothetical protein FWD73_07115 [Polyangiaceae bacterium]|nr:hypothetical protein [Polyangiaceae bacterium]
MSDAKYVIDIETGQNILEILQQATKLLHAVADVNSEASMLLEMLKQIALAATPASTEVQHDPLP